MASVRDVSERRAAEQALRQSEQRTRSILDNMLGGLITIDDGAQHRVGQPRGGADLRLRARRAGRAAPWPCSSRRAWATAAPTCARPSRGPSGASRNGAGGARTARSSRSSCPCSSSQTGGGPPLRGQRARRVGAARRGEAQEGVRLHRQPRAAHAPHLHPRLPEPAGGRRAGRPLRRGAGDGDHRRAELRAPHRPRQRHPGPGAAGARPPAHGDRRGRDRGRSLARAARRRARASPRSDRSRWSSEPTATARSRATPAASSRCW